MASTSTRFIKSTALIFSLWFSNTALSQDKHAWSSKDLFERRFFVENKGQFDEIPSDKSAKILYQAYSKGVNFYFTNNGVIFKGHALIKRSRKEIKQILWAKEAEQKNGPKDLAAKKAYEEHEENEKLELAYKDGFVYEQMQWVKSNDNVKVTVEQEVAGNYLYGDKETHQTIFCKGFKKLIYHDIYPNIDVEFYFPEDSAGFKYNYRVKPGGDPSLIAEKWLNANDIQLNAQGDISINTPFGTINSKKPYSFYPEKKLPVNTAYMINDNIVSYVLAEITEGLLIIDPWTTVTTLGATYNKGYDVDYDNYGNTYVYGGPSPFMLQKYGPTGLLSWSYTTSLFGGTPTYGDFAVDRNTGRSYIVSAFSSSTSLIKLSSSGTFVDDFADGTISEMWRIIFDTASNHLIIGVGLTSDQLVYLDTSLVTFSAHNVIGPSAYATDVVFLATDNASNCYFLYSYWSPATYVNEIIKVPVPSFASITYTVPSEHYFLEALSPKYGPPGYYMNGFNGLAIAGNNLFTYDSYKIKKRDISTGALLISKYKNLPVASDSSHMYWGGLATDPCNKDVFIGSRDTVFHYDSMLVLKATFPMTGIVIDIQVSDGLVYVTGEGFVSTFEIAPCGCTTVNPGLLVTHLSCNGSGDGTITFSPSGGIEPYTYDWGSLGLSSNDSTATGLGAGVYPVELSDSAGCSQNLNVLVTQPAPLSIAIDPDTVNCFGNTTMLVGQPAGGTGPYTVVWNTPLPVLNDTLPIAAPGVYSVTVTDANGCSSTFSHTLYEPAPLSGTLASVDVSCDGTVLGSITATINGGTGPYNYTWSGDPGETSNISSGLSGGIYGLTVTDDNGCTISFTDTILQLTFPTISFTNVQPCYNGSNGTITATATGGTPGETFTYSWNTVPVQTGLIANNIGAGAYILSVTSNGCTFTFPAVLNENAIIDTLKINGVICGVDDFVTLYLPVQAQAVYEWYNGGVLIPGETGSSYNSPIPDAGFISATWYMGGCNYLTTTVETDEYPVAAVKSIPNVFSPNSDGLNSMFYAFTFSASTSNDKLDYLFEEFTMQVFNRWGQLVFETNDPAKGWDGKKGGGEVPEGVYFVMIKFRALCADKKDEIIYNGTVQLVR